MAAAAASAAAPLTAWHSVSASAAATRDLAAALAVVARRGDRVALIGPLGAGKTQFAKGFAAGLGIVDVVNSPSFTLMAEYEGRLPLYHQDLYRVRGTAEALADGLLDERQADGVVLAEWGDRLADDPDPEQVEVIITPVGDVRRRVELRGRGEAAARYAAAARAWSELRR